MHFNFVFFRLNSNRVSSISTFSAASASVHVHVHVYKSTTRDDYNCYDLRTKKLHEGQLHKERCLQRASTDLSLATPCSRWHVGIRSFVCHQDLSLKAGSINEHDCSIVWFKDIKSFLTWHGHLFVVNCINTWRSIHCSLWQILGVPCMGVCLHDYGVNINIYVCVCKINNLLH